MKNTFKTLILLIISIFFIGCEEDLLVFDPDNGQTALAFSATDFNVIVPEEDTSITIPVTSTTRSNDVRSFNVTVNQEESTDGIDSEYTLGSIVIPAGEFSGELQVDFDFSEITGDDGVVKTLVFNISPDEGDTAYNDEVTIEYFREIVCNDLELTIITDVWATETGFRIENGDGSVLIADFFPFSQNLTTPQTYNESFFLPDGDYIFYLLDTYGDGQQGTGGGVTLTGSYELTCSIITHASGEGALDNDTFEATPFSVNP